MPELTDEQLERVRDLTERTADRVEKYHTEEWQQKAHAGLYRSIGSHARRHAIFSLITGTPDTVRQSFEQSAHGYVDCVKMAQVELQPGKLATLTGAPIKLAKAFYTGVLSGDDETLSRVAETALDLPFEVEVPYDEVDETITFDADKYHLALALAAVAADQPETATDHAEQLRAANVDNEGVNELHFRASIEFVEGMVDRDADMVEQGIRSMIERHERQYDPQNVSDKIACLEATSFLVLARKRGLDVAVDSEFIPGDYVEWLLAEWTDD